jgi:hypothetical protein
MTASPPDAVPMTDPIIAISPNSAVPTFKFVCRIQCPRMLETVIEKPDGEFATQLNAEATRIHVRLKQ